MGISSNLSDFCHEITYDALPQEVKKQSKYFFLDELCLIIRGQSVDSTKTIMEFAKRVGAGSVPVTGTRETLLPQYAALVNGASCHSLELDDVGDEASAHPGTLLYPMLLPMGYELQSDGKTFLAAVVAGYEAMIKIGKVLTPNHMYGMGYHPTTLCGNFGTSVAAAKMLKLDKTRTRMALGMAGSIACGTMQCLTENTPGKRFQAGWAAHNGYLIGRLAEAGFRGPGQILEGRDGVFKAYGRPNPDLSLIDPDTFGNPWEIMRTSVKPHACCGYHLAVLDVVQELVRKHDIKPGDVKKVRVGLFTQGMPLVAEPRDVKINPQKQVDTQFSTHYGVAVSILRRRALLDDHTEDLCNDPVMKELMSKVECVADDALQARYPKQWGAWAEIETNGGQTHYAATADRKGSPANPVTLEEMVGKFKAVADPVLKPGASDAIIEAVNNFDKETNVRNFHALLDEALR